MVVSHAVYGLRVASNRPLPGLAVCDEAGSIDLQIWIKDPRAVASKPFLSLNNPFYTSRQCIAIGEPVLRVGTLEDGRYFGFFYGDGARFAVERQGREIWVNWPENYAFEDACTYLLGPVLAFALRLRGATCLHASSIALGGHAIALMGAPGAGKSTAAAAFAHLGFPVLSDDLVVLAERDDRFLVHSGYPRVNLWPDSVRALFGFKDALPRITPTWDKRYMALDQKECLFHAAPLPLGAIYLLEERENTLAAPDIRELTAGEAFLRLVANTYVNYLLDAGMKVRDFDVLARVVAKIRVLSVRLPNNPSKVFDLCAQIRSDASRLGAPQGKFLR